MATQAKSAYGTILTIAGTAIPEIRSITEAGLSYNMIDVSAHDGNGWGSMLPGLKRGKPMTVEYNLVPSNPQHVALRNASETRASVVFTLTLPTSGNPVLTFNAFVNDIGSPTLAVDGAVTGRAILTPDGPLVWT
jgi:hypothetical protein